MGEARSDSVLKNKNKNKIFLVKFFGGKCQECGYNKCVSALTFHHLDPSQKEFNISGSGKSLNSLLEEAKKCILLCRNCHAEVHAPQSHFLFMDVDVSGFDKKDKIKNYKECIVCNNKHENYMYCSVNCVKNAEKQIRPTEEMIRLMKIHKNFTKVGKILNCTANAIKKRMLKDCPEDVKKYLYKPRNLNNVGNCLICKKEIIKRKHYQKYCSNLCFKVHSEKKYRENIPKILEILPLGLTTKQMAKKLQIHRRTLENYITKYKTNK